MKVISENVIKKLIKLKLVENYKKKILNENETQQFSDLQKQQIIASGLIESIYIYLTDSRYNTNVGPLLGTQKDKLIHVLKGILSSDTFKIFKQNIRNLILNLDEDLNSQIFFLISGNELFTKLLAYDDIIIETFNNKMSEIIANKAFIQKNDLTLIYNHSSGDVNSNEYQFVYNNITTTIDSLLSQKGIKLNPEQIKDKILNLLKVINMNVPVVKEKSTNNNQTQINADFNLDNFNLSENQKNKIQNYVEAQVENATNNYQDNQEYRNLLLQLFQIKFDQSSSAAEKKQAAAAAINNNNSLNTTQAQSAIDLTKTVAAAVNNNASDASTQIKPSQPTDKDLFKLPRYLATTKNEQRYNKLLNYITSIDELEKLFKHKPRLGFINKTEREITRFFALLVSPLNQYGNVKFEYDSDIFKKLQQKVIILRKNRDKGNVKEKQKFVGYIKDYFNNQQLTGNYYIILDKNFINYLHLRILNDIDNSLESVKNEIAGFRKFSSIQKNATIAADTTSTTSNTSTTSTTKKCFIENSENKQHTDNFKLYPAKSIEGVKTPDNYRTAIAKYLLNNSAPLGYGFINKNDEQKIEYAKKLTDAVLNENQIAAALKKLYPNAEIKTSKEYWKENKFININADEIIRVAKKP